jgi:3-methyladenine DNA glycosylase/8-oxoguanine DNA glycosylase
VPRIVRTRKWHFQTVRSVSKIINSSQISGILSITARSATKGENLLVKLENSFSFTLQPKPPYNFQLTVRKPAGWDLFTPDEIYGDHDLWTALYIENLLIGLKLKSKGTTNSPKISVIAYSKKSLTAHQKLAVKQTVSLKLSVDDALNEFYALAKDDKILKYTVEDLYGMHDTQSSSLFGAAILSICLQMAPLKRSHRMMDCIWKRYGEVAEFNGKQVQIWPQPKSMAKLNIREFSKECNLGFRAKYIVQLAKSLVTGAFPSLEDLGKLSPKVAREKLLELPGIGDYSADIISPHGGFPIDVWTAEVFGKLFFHIQPANARKIVDKVKEEGIRRWGKLSWMAFFYVVNDLENLSTHLNLKLRLA